MPEKPLKIFIAVLCVLFSVQSNAQRKEPELTFEQKQELKLRAAKQSLEGMYIDPEIIQLGIDLDENNDKAEKNRILPPDDRRVRSITVKPNDIKLYDVRVFPNQVTTVIMTDNYGEAWPLLSAPIVASDTYKVDYNPEIPGLFTIQTSEKFVPSSLTLLLKDRLRPVQLMLNSDNDFYHYSVDIQVVGVSPTNEVAKINPYSGLNIPTHDNDSLDLFLRNPPPEARLLETIGSSDVDVWAWQGNIVIRSMHMLIDPQPSPHIKSSMDTKEKVFLVKPPVELLTLLNETTGDIIQVDVLGGMNGQ